jgi:hypothetical protein
MQNIEMQVDDDMLTLTIDLSERHGSSSSGKSIIVASTEGNVTVPDHPDIKLGVNVYTPSNY